MQFIKDKSSIKYYILALACVLCVYSSQISNLFIPIFDNVYYGNLVKMYVSISNMVIWGIELIALYLVCRKLKVPVFKNVNKSKELPFLRLVLLFVLTILPMIAISVYLNFQVKIIYQLGIRVTSVGLSNNACEILSWLLRFAFMILFIHFMHLGLETNFKFKTDKLNKYFPWGAILSILVFGLIDFFLFPVDLNWFYLIMTFWYGIIYIVADKKVLTTYVISYLIWLL